MTLDIAIRQIKELIHDIETKSYIPKKYAKAPFTDEIRLEYLGYLKRELKRMEKRAQEKLQ